ncbi:LamG-like jellyroll fold domain-containing protein [Aeoliella mucimassa]|uniref:FecR protein n=1 Tax=Aeoliella mucimassa TaxID=2527972 RepID=A0A518AMD2_9BACT|nr:LamG-like jellyroll fold domain-containing protein [Aeoliella mucimassa]QDU55884.1 FecR protein [Aeoliella mucimassa]
MIFDSRNSDSSSDAAMLCSAYLDGSITETDFAQLVDWLKSSEEHRREFSRISMLHTNLQVVMQHNDMVDFFAEDQSPDSCFTMVDPRNIRIMLEEAAEAAARRAKEAAERAAAEAAEAERKRREEEERNRPDRPKPIEIPQSAAYLAAAVLAASLLLAVSAFWHSQESATQQVVSHSQTDQAPPALPTIATLTTSIDTKWSDADASLAVGSRLMAGPLRLDHGMAQIDLDDGASVVLESPISLDLLSAGRIRLLQGKLVAQVPERAIGFTVTAGTSNIVDLGTEFGIDMRNEGGFGVHVLDGEIALKLKKEEGNDLPSESLHAGTARAVDPTGEVSKKIAMDRHVFIRRVPSTSFELAMLKSRPTAYWRFNEPESSTTIKSLGELEHESGLSPGIALGVENRRTEAGNRMASFSVPHQGIDVGVHRELALTRDFTIESWIVTPDNVDLSTPRRIISSFSEPNSGFAFGIAGHAFAGSNEFPSMTLLFTFYGQYDCLSLAGLRPNELYHVAVTVDSQGKPSLFVDGSPVPCKFNALSLTDDGYQTVPDNWNPQLIGTPSSNVRIGGNPPSQGQTYPEESWDGSIDEIAVFDRALSAEEIQMHYQAGLR